MENKTEKVTVNGGISFCGLLTIAFIVLKLLKVINWSWWWVLAPTWIPIALLIVGVVIALIVSTSLSAIGEHHKKGKRKKENKK